MPTDKALENVDVADIPEPTELMRAAQRGDLGEVRALIDAGADVHAADHVGMTPLLYAADRGHDRVIAVLIAAGADIHAADMYRVTALMLAVGCNSPAAIGCVLEHHVDVNARDASGRTALMYAIDNDALFAADALVQAGADVDAADATGMPSLMQASFVGAEFIMERLLRAGANPDARNASGSTALMYAVDGEDGERRSALGLLIIYGAEIDAVDGHGNSALLRAALAGKWGLVEILRAHGARMDLANCHGITAENLLWFAFQAQDSESDEEAQLPQALLPAQSAETPGAESDASFCWHAADDVLNQAFDASMRDDELVALQPVCVAGAEAVGMRVHSE